MNIVQVLPSLASRDAIGVHTLNLAQPVSKRRSITAMQVMTSPIEVFP